MGFENIVNAAEGLNGYSLAITGMAIVFTALILVSLFIAWLPRLLPIVDGVLPVIEHHHGAPMPSAPARPSGSTAMDEEIVAAIGVALHQRTRKR